MRKIKLPLVLLFIMLSSNIIKAQNIAINEIVASNDTIIADEDGDFEDFIEIYNYDSVAINLENFGLSDDESDPFQWVFPNITIQPNEYLLLWASKKDKTNPTKPLHTNFKISSGGEAIALTHSNGTLLNQSPATALVADTSLGRIPNGTGAFTVFQNPTPNQRNVSETVPVEPPTFSHTSGFFSSTVPLKITHSDPTVTILYSLDGSEPKAENIGGVNYNYKNSYPELPGQGTGSLLTESFETLTYNSTITLNDRSTDTNKIANISTTLHYNPAYFPNVKLKKATVVKARALNNGVLSPVVTHTYFISNTNAFQTNLPIVSLSVDEDKLFDYNNGIYVAGVDFDEWRMNNPSFNGNTYYNPITSSYAESNFRRSGIESEKKATFQYFDNQNLVINQNIGIRLHGSSSRGFRQKTFRLYAKSEYDEQNIFEYPFFGKDRLKKHKRLILRNSGRDFYLTMFRDAFNHELVRNLGFETQSYQPTVTYVNGEYFGILNLRERFDSKYFENKYNIQEEDIQIVDIHSYKFATAQEGDITDYDNLYNFIDNNDLSNTVNYEEVANKMDIDDFINYQIANIFIANHDWPNNNTRLYRKNTTQLLENDPYAHDGKWRWMYFDTDWGFGGLVGADDAYVFNSLARAIYHNSYYRRWSTVFMNKLIENNNFREKLIVRYADLLNTTFSTSRTTALLNSISNKIRNEIPKHNERWGAINDWQHNVDVMLNFADQRPQYARNHIRVQFNIDKNINIQVNVSHQEHGYIKINTINIKESTVGVSANPYPWSGIYFHNIPITLTANAKAGYQFSHWSGASTSTNKTIIITPTEDFSITANYIPITDLSEQLVHYWLFDGELENNKPFTSLSSTYSAQETNAKINFESALVGYPFNDTHTNWRKASMERKKEPTDLNYFSSANNNITFEDASVKGLQIKQPFNVDGKENIMSFNVSTENYENIKVSFAVLDDDGAADILKIDYLNVNNKWISFSSNAITASYQLIEIDFSSVTEASNNTNFQYRIRFGGTDMTADNGERVIFNNIAIKGTPIEGKITDIPENSLTPTFAQLLAVCEGESIAPLPTVSENGISGTWSPALDNTQTTTYTFTPDSVLAQETTMVISVYANEEVVTPIFNQVPKSICRGVTKTPLPTISENGISGTWSPVFNNAKATTYTFTPNEADCFTPVSTILSIEIDRSCSVSSTSLKIEANGILFVSPNEFLYIDKDLTVDEGGELTVSSDAENSGSLLVTDTSTGKVTYKRYLKGENDASTIGSTWHLISTPVGTQNIKTFAEKVFNDVSKSGNKYAIAYYENDNFFNDKWEYYTTSSNENFITGKGYLTQRKTDGFYNFKGELPDTDVSISIALNGSKHLWSSVGNPYASFLSANNSSNSVLKDNEDVLNPNNIALHVWNKETNEYDVYNYTENIDKDLIPGQAFMVEFNSNNPIFTFSKNLQKPQQNIADYFSREEVNPTIVVLLNNGSKTVKTKLKYISTATKGLDKGYDAGAYQEGTPSFAINSHLVSESNGIDFTLQCLPNTNYENTIVPLSVYANKNETISFNAETTNLPEGVNVYIEDTLKNTIENIKEKTYSVTLQSAAQGIGRFYLHTSSSVLNIENNTISEVVNLYKKDNNTIRITGFNNLEKASFKMYSIIGQEVLTKNFSTQRVNDIAIPSLAVGVYLIQVNSNNKKYTKKIIIN